MVEFALILPIFLVLTLGVVDMARLFTSYISLTNGVSSAAIYAGGGAYLSWCATGGAVPCPVKDAAGAPYTTPSTNKAADPANIAYQINIECDWTDARPDHAAPSPCAHRPRVPPLRWRCTSTASGAYSRVTVTASYNFQFLTPFVSNLTGPITMTASTSAAVLN